MNGRVAIAYHEAGHAVLGVLAGGEIIHVRLTDEAEVVRGETRMYPPDDPQDALLVLWAGPLAEAIATGSPAAVNDNDFEAMIQEALAIDGVASRESAVERLRGFEGLARSLVQRHWPVIDRLARTLLAEGPLDGARVLAIVDS